MFSKVVNESAAYRKRLDEAKLAGEGTTQPIPHPQEIADAMLTVMQDDLGLPFSNLEEAVDRWGDTCHVGPQLQFF